MKKLKTWIRDTFLPAWCRETLLAENKALRQALDDARRENERLSAYIRGMHRAMRRQPRIQIAKEVKQD